MRFVKASGRPLVTSFERDVDSAIASDLSGTHVVFADRTPLERIANDIDREVAAKTCKGF